MYDLQQIMAALVKLGVDTTRLSAAISELKQALADLDDVEVKGRQRVDTLLGCMMAIEAILGEEQNNG